MNKHKRRGRFRNEIAFSNLTGWHDRKSKQAIPVGMLPVEKPEIAEHADEGELKVTWLGHSTSFLQVGDQNILIDPVLSSRVSPLGFVGPKRFSDCAFEKEDVPDIQVVFISHDHYDHLDQATIMAMDARVGCYIVPLGVDSILKSWGIDENKLHPLDWWEVIEQKGITYTLTPALHYTGRSPLKLNSTLWGGVYIRGTGHSVYYSGDTGYYDVFKQVYKHFGETDLMLADSGQYDRGWAQTHMFPEQTVKAARDAHAKWLIPVHWGAFATSNHSWFDPPERALRAAEEMGVNIALPKLGQTVSYDAIASCDKHWWKACR